MSAGIIESSVADAGTHASSIAGNYIQITGVGDAAKDTVSRFPGNSQAHDAIDREKTNATTAGAKSVDFVQVLQTMASEFQTTDSRIANAIASAAAGTQTTEAGTDISLFSEGGKNL